MKRVLLASLLVTGCRLVSTDDGPGPGPMTPPPDGTARPYQGEIDLGAGGITAIFTNVGGISQFCDTGRLEGSCCLAPPAEVADGTSYVDAGPLTISNVTTGQSGTAMFDPNQQSYGALAPLPVWTTGDSVEVYAAGATVATFVAETSIPAPVTGLAVSPFAPSGARVTWTPGDSGILEIRITGTQGVVTCRPQDSSGTLALGPAELNTLGQGLVQVDVVRKNIEPASTGALINVVGQTSAGVATTVSLTN
jgi:hypothetical protein